MTKRQRRRKGKKHFSAKVLSEVEQEEIATAPLDEPWQSWIAR
jgi:hypothetical protein